MADRRNAHLSVSGVPEFPAHIAPSFLSFPSPKTQWFTAKTKAMNFQLTKSLPQEGNERTGLFLQIW